MSVDSYDLKWIAFLSISFSTLTYTIGYYRGVARSNDWWTKEMDRLFGTIKDLIK